MKNSGMILTMTLVLLVGATAFGQSAEGEDPAVAQVAELEKFTAKLEASTITLNEWTEKLNVSTAELKAKTDELNANLEKLDEALRELEKAKANMVASGGSLDEEMKKLEASTRKIQNGMVRLAVAFGIFIFCMIVFLMLFVVPNLRDSPERKGGGS